MIIAFFDHQYAVNHKHAAQYQSVNKHFCSQVSNFPHDAVNSPRSGYPVSGEFTMNEHLSTQPSLCGKFS
jgi:hypothetical protein